jgi:ribonuclease PH
VTGAYVGLALALGRLIETDGLPAELLTTPVAAVSVGVVAGDLLLDLCYEEDAAAAVDLNIVMTGSGKFVEIQGTAEAEPFERDTLTALIDLAGQGIERLLGAQEQALRQL